MEKSKTNPLEIEILRTRLANTKDYIKFKETYNAGYPVIKADNTDKFWSDKFKSPEYFDELDQMTKEKIDIIISLLPNKKNRILDLGIGQGYLEQRLVQLGKKYRLYGLDISTKSIIRARNNFNGKFLIGNILKTENYYTQSFFDAVVAIEVIEHISPIKIFDFYRQVRTILKKGGVFIISTPLNEGLANMKSNPSSHVREYTEPIVTSELRLSGFKVLRKSHLYAFNHYYSFKKLLTKFMTKRWKPNNLIVKAIKV